MRSRVSDDSGGNSLQNNNFIAFSAMRRPLGLKPDAYAWKTRIRPHAGAGFVAQTSSCQRAYPTISSDDED